MDNNTLAAIPKLEGSASYPPVIPAVKVENGKLILEMTIKDVVKATHLTKKGDSSGFMVSAASFQDPATDTNFTIRPGWITFSAR